MGYIGNSYSQQAITPATDFFSGNGVTTTFQLTRPVASNYAIEVVVNNIQQNPANAYTINASNQLVLTGAPSTGTSNIYVMYGGIVAQPNQPGQGTVGSSQLGSISNINSIGSNMTLQTNGATAITIDTSQNTILNNGVLTPVSTTGVLNVNTTAALKLPNGSTGQRPTPANGYFRYNNSIGNGIIEYYNAGGSWLTLSVAADGSSAAQAGFSAQTIKNLSGTTTSGYYWITLGGTPRQVWCDMSTSIGWMLAMRCANNTNTFRYAASYWTDSSTLNETADPLTNTDIKNNYLWQNFACTTIRLTGSQTTTAYTSNPLVFTGFNATLNTIFNQGNAIYDGNIALGRTAWLNWFNAVTATATSVFDNQPNCNVDQINANYTYAGARIGLVMNNENDCGTDDAAVGFGTYGNSNSGDGTGCGGTSWNPGNQYRGHGWLWIA
jgi:hypothetical protein